MTERIAIAVRDALVSQGVPATFEYPGYVSIYITQDFILVVNDLDDTISVDVMVDNQAKCQESIESGIPVAHEDSSRIAEFVAVTYRQALEVHEEAGKAKVRK